MPFTPTHLLAAVPVSRFWPGKVPAAALAIGTVAPDWPLFVPWGPDYLATHSLPGTFTHALPVALLILSIWRWLIADPLRELAPEILRSRWRASPVVTPLLQPRRWMMTLLAMWLGILTHVVWDAFTHRDQWGVALLPLLSRDWLELGGVVLPGYKVLQHGSSIVGLPILGLWLWWWTRRSGVVAHDQPALPPRVHRVLGGGLILVTLSVGCGSALGMMATIENWQSLRPAVYIGIVSGVRTMAVGILLYCLGFKLWQRCRS